MKKPFWIIVLLAVSCNTTKDKIQLSPPPIITPGPVTQEYWGTSVTDEYRNLENLEDTTVQKWFKTQAAYADDIIEHLPLRDSLVAKIQEYDKKEEYYISFHRVTLNDQYFYLKKYVDEKHRKLYYRATENAEEELLYDPEDFKPESGKEYTINYIRPSWDGQYIAVAMSYEGREISEVIIIDMRTRKPLPQIIDHCLPSGFYGVKWLPDNSGFVYIHFPVIDRSDKGYRKHTAAVLYRIGQDPKKLNIILSAKNNPELNLNPDFFPKIDLNVNSDKYAIAYMTSVGRYFDAYYADLKDITNGKKVAWKPLFTEADQVYRSFAVVRGDEYIFRSAKDAPNFQIAKVNLTNPDFNSPTILVPERPDEVIEDYVVTSDGLYYTTTENGLKAKFYHIDNKGQEKQIDLPKESGYSTLSYKGVNYPDVGVSVKGWTTPYRQYKYDPKTSSFTLYPHTSPIVDFPPYDNLIVKEVMVTSHDGVEVPLSIIHKKGIEKSGDHPTMLFGYGAYGNAINPYFSPWFLTWVREGGIFCVAHVRGGGEKGDDWRKAGFKTTKPNTWKDLIACTEYMIKEGYTSNKHTVIESSSAGGIMIGRAMTERPDLFAVAIAQVGLMNPLRIEAAGMGDNYKEFGSVKDSLETMALIEMDPYLHIEKGVKYPATLITAGMNDPRLPPWMPGKFVAKLQAYNASDKPILFIPIYDSGHGSNSIEEGDRKWANLLAFALWQTGHPDYQYQENMTGE